MASQSLRSMYKVKIREENTISSRRMSRRLERKKHRDDEVNKRRLLSDDMSPVMEGNDSHDRHSFSQQEIPHKPIVHEKVLTQRERLKQWREEKKRKTEQQKNSQKPAFKVAQLKHPEESNLYKRAPIHEMRPIIKQAKCLDDNKMSHSAPDIKQSNMGRHSMKATTGQAGSDKLSSFGGSSLRKPVNHHVSEAAATRHQRVPASKSDPLVKSTQHPLLKETAAKAVHKPFTRNGGRVETLQKEIRTDLSSKLTVSAAAKAKVNLDKPKEFLRANSRVTRSSAQDRQVGLRKKENRQKQKNTKLAEPPQEKNCVAIVDSSESKISETCSNSQELHLSDSAVSTPKHSTPASRRKSKRGKDSPKRRPSKRVKVLDDSSSRELSVIHAVDIPSEQPVQEEEVDNLLTGNPEPAVSCESIVSDHTQVSSFSNEVSKRSRLDDMSQPSPTVHVDTSIGDTETPFVNLLEMSNKENVACKQTHTSCNKSALQQFSGTPLFHQQFTLGSADIRRGPGSACAATTARKSQEEQSSSRQLASTDNVQVKPDLVGSSTPGTTGHSRTSAYGTRSLVDMESPDPSVIQTIASKTQPRDTSLPATGAPLQGSSVVRTRRSVRIATQTFSSPSEDKLVSAKYRKTPAIRRQSHREGENLSQVENGKSTFKSASDEGASVFTGHTGAEIQLDVAAGYNQTDRVAKLPSSRQIAHEPSTPYQVSKPVKVESSVRILQELAVNKVEGEASFIEVSLDESVNDHVADSTVSVPPVATIAGSILEDVSSAIDEGSQSTQPFTPRSDEITSDHISVISKTWSDENEGISLTPKLPKNRGQSMGGLSSFKTPQQPASGKCRKANKRRNTEMDTPLKSAEEMIEILKKSPMVELTRRRSRHIPSSVSPCGLSQLMMTTPANVVIPDVAAIPQSEVLEITTCQAAPVDGPQVITGMSPLQVDSGVKHFRQLLSSETEKLKQLCHTWSHISTCTQNLAEDVLGQIRSSIGKAQLLMEQRFQQFSGLVDNCQFGLGEKETTLTDLQGFWEMVYFQVEDVHQLFASLAELQQKNWNTKQSPTRIMRKRKVVKIGKPKVKSNFAAFRDEFMKRKAQVAEAKPEERPNEIDAGTHPVRSSSGRKSGHLSPLKSAASAKRLSSQDSLSQNDQDSTAEGSRDQTGGPGKTENTVSGTIGYHLPLSAKRRSYLPPVPSPLLNDITGLLGKKL